MESVGSFHVVSQLIFEDLTAVRMLSSPSILGIVLIRASLVVIEHHNKSNVERKGSFPLYHAPSKEVGAGTQIRQEPEGRS